MSRPIERIPTFLDIVFRRDNLEKVIKDIFQLEFGAHIIIEDNIKANRASLEEIWIENYDWRFSQLLINTDFLPNIPGFWYYMEEDEILKRLEDKDG